MDLGNINSLIDKINKDEKNQSKTISTQTPKSGSGINLDNAFNKIEQKYKNTNQNQIKAKTTTTTTKKAVSPIIKKSPPKHTNIIDIESHYRNTIKRFFSSSKSYFDRIKENETSYNSKKIVLDKDYEKEMAEFERESKLDFEKLDKKYKEDCKRTKEKEQHDINALNNVVSQYNNDINVLKDNIKSEMTTTDSILSNKIMKFINKSQTAQSAAAQIPTNVSEDDNPKIYIKFLSDRLQQMQSVRKELSNHFLSLQDYRNKQSLIIKTLISILLLSSLYPLWLYFIK